MVGAAGIIFSGHVTVSLNLTNFTGTVLVSACVAPGNNPCQTIAGNSVAANMISLQAVAGEGQVVTGLSFQPMTVRVTDLSTPPNGVLGETVLFQSTVMRPVKNGSAQIPTDPSAIPAILSESETIGQSDVNGLATFVPSVGSFTGPLEVVIQISAGTAATLQGQMEIIPAGAAGNVSRPTSIPWHGPRTPEESPRDPRNPDRRMENQ